MERKHQQILLGKRSELVDMLGRSIEADGLYTELLSHGVLGPREETDIRLKGSGYKQAEALLDRLPTKGRGAFSLFIEALEAADNIAVVEILKSACEEYQVLETDEQPRPSTSSQNSIGSLEIIQKELKARLREKMLEWCKPILDTKKYPETAVNSLYIPTKCSVKHVEKSDSNAKISSPNIKENVYDNILKLLSNAKPGARLILPANAGMGKTLLTKYIGDAWIDGDEGLAKYSLFVPVALRYVNYPKFINGIGTECLGLIPDIMKDKLLSVLELVSVQNHTLIYIDSYEEKQPSGQLASEWDDIISGKMFPGAVVLVATRPHTLEFTLKEHLPDSYSIVEQTTFTEDEARIFFNRLAISESVQLKLMFKLPTELITSPLLLSLVCNTLSAERTNINRTNLFKSCLCESISALYVKEWQQHKRRKVSWDLLGFDIDARIKVLILDLGKACNIARKNNVYYLSFSVLSEVNLDSEICGQFGFCDTSGEPGAPSDMLYYRNSYVHSTSSLHLKNVKK